MKKIETKLVEQKKPILNRRDALKKVGKYAAVTALGTFLILNPQKAQAMSASPPPEPGSGGGF
ncbi:MAG: twin-arginine translocation signal domain-containing protein [Flavobacteriales bacterium]